jgi:hypothetical protein
VYLKLAISCPYLRGNYRLLRKKMDNNSEENYVNSGLFESEN